MSERIEDVSKAREMAEDSDYSHTKAEKARKEGDLEDLRHHENQAVIDERLAAVKYDTEKEIQGLSPAELQGLLKEASEAENESARFYQNTGNKEGLKELTHLKLMQRRAVIETAVKRVK